MPDTTSTVTEPNTVEVKYEVTNSHDEEETENSIETTPAAVVCSVEEDKTVKPNEVKVIEVKESATPKKVTRVNSVNENKGNSKPATPKMNTEAKPALIKQHSNGTKVTNNNNKVTSPAVKAINKVNKPAVKNAPPKAAPQKKPAVSKPAVTRQVMVKKTSTKPQTAKKAPSNLPASPKKAAPNATSTPIKATAVTAITNEQPTQNGMAFEIKPAGLPMKKPTRKPIKVASVKPPKIQPRPKSPVKTAKVAVSSGGAWR